MAYLIDKIVKQITAHAESLHEEVEIMAKVNIILEQSALADLDGTCPAHAPLRVHILSFRHTKFSKRNCLRSPRPL